MKTEMPFSGRKYEIRGALPGRGHHSVKVSDGHIPPVGFYFDIFILLITVVFQFSLVFLFIHNSFMVQWTEMTKMKDFQDFFWE